MRRRRPGTVLQEQEQGRLPGPPRVARVAGPGQTGRGRYAAGLRELTAHRPVTVFLTLVLGGGWALLAVPVLAARGVLPGRALPVEVFALAVTVLVMLPAALWVTAVADGRQAVRDLLGRAVRWRFGAGWWAAVLLAMPVVTLAAGLALGGRLDGSDVPSTLLSGALSLVVAVAVVHLWEETVWAGFLQTRWERRYGLVVGAVLTAVPFTALHLPLLLLDPVRLEAAVLPVLLADAGRLLVLAVGLRLLLGVFVRATGGSLLAVGVLHGVFNASNNQAGPVDGLLGGADQGLAAAAALVLVTASAAVLCRPARAATPRPAASPSAPRPDAVAVPRARTGDRGDRVHRPLHRQRLDGPE